VADADEDVPYRVPDRVSHRLLLPGLPPLLVSIVHVYLWLNCSVSDLLPLVLIRIFFASGHISKAISHIFLTP